MGLVINTNTAATSASANLNASNAMLQKSLSRLSSGNKIVSPADDAGGLAVSMKLTAAIRRNDAVHTNVSNAVSFLQTQDGAMKTASKMLDRMSELRTLYDDVTKSSLTSDILLPGIDNCIKCHGNTSGAARPASADCVECHRYHESGHGIDRMMLEGNLGIDWRDWGTNASQSTPKSPAEETRPVSKANRPDEQQATRDE